MKDAVDKEELEWKKAEREGIWRTGGNKDVGVGEVDVAVHAEAGGMEMGM